jgi:hypothetical protein
MDRALWTIVYMLVGVALVAIPYVFVVAITRTARWLRR